MKCPKCHAELPDKAKFCLECGFAVSSAGSQAERRSSASDLSINYGDTIIAPGEPTTSGANFSAPSDRYEILELRGQGGMGAVYKARDTKLNIEVAYKRLSTEMADSSLGVKRFLNEAQSIAQLNHQNIVQVKDVGEDVHGHLEVVPRIRTAC